MTDGYIHIKLQIKSFIKICWKFLRLTLKPPISLFFMVFLWRLFIFILKDLFKLRKITPLSKLQISYIMQYESLSDLANKCNNQASPINILFLS